MVYARYTRSRIYSNREREERGSEKASYIPVGLFCSKRGKRAATRERRRLRRQRAASTKKTPSKKRLEDYEHRRRRRHRVPCPPINTDASPFQIASRNSTMSYPDRRGREKGGPTRPVGRTFG